MRNKKPPAMRVVGKLLYKKSLPLHYNIDVQAILEMKGRD